MSNVDFVWEDIFSIVALVKGHLIFIGIALVVMIAAMVLAGKAGKGKTKFVRLQSLLAFVLVTVLAVNGMCTGPLRNPISVVMSETKELTAENVQKSRALVEEITNEGIVLVKNEDHFLPMNPGNLNVFGWTSTNPIYGGTGSGAVDISTAVDILGGLENSGFTLNTELSDLYRAYREDRPAITINNGQEWTLPEIPAEDYGSLVIDSAKAFSDTAVIVIGRPGGEGADLPHDMGAVMDGSLNEVGTKYLRPSYVNNSDSYDDFQAGQSYLELSQTEKKLVEMVCDQFDQVVVVYNGANPLEMGWTEEYEQIKSVLICPGAGSTGFNALGNILSDKVNPSGKTVDTWVHDLTNTPYYNNIGHFAYTNTGDVSAAAKAAWERADGIVSFVNYTEGIYVGYRFYETAAAEGFIDYDSTVQYPFGYGLSYTGFRQEMGSLNVSGDTISVDVKVTNTGSTAGKEVVQLYYTPPYTNGGIEKASVNLAAFDKTDLLEPGQSQTLTLTFHISDMASYDTYGHGRCVLEAGAYVISLRADSHTVVAEETYTAAGDVIYDENNTHNGDLDVAENRLGFAEGNRTYLSRENGFANYEQAVAAPTDYEVHGVVTGNGTYDPAQFNNPDDVMPVTGAKNGMELFELRGADYDDPRWETLLDQVGIDEMVNLIAYGGHQTVAVESVKKLGTYDTDGPQGVNSTTHSAFGTGYCSEIIIAQTWNEDLAYEAGQGICSELLDFGIIGWYAPSMNMHRSAFAGRNFEYYSEDGVLSARMGLAESKGAVAAGAYPYLKHFAFNDQEINRNALLCTWMTEQSARELYLSPFEYCVKNTQPGTIAIMSAYNYLGTEWVGGCKEIQTDILRGEWGFRGMVLSDYFGNYGYMDADRAIRGGTDIMLGTAGNEAIMTDTTSPTSVLAMRQATRNVFYTVVNSGIYENYVPGSIPSWMQTMYTIDAVMAILWLACEVLVVRGYLRKKKEKVV